MRYIINAKILTGDRHFKGFIENFEKIGKSKFSKKKFAEISFRNRIYANFSKEAVLLK